MNNDINYVRTRKEIVDKIEEIYERMKNNQIGVVEGILYSDALSYALGEDYLDFEYTDKVVK